MALVFLSYNTLLSFLTFFVSLALSLRRASLLQLMSGRTLGAGQLLWTRSGFALLGDFWLDGHFLGSAGPVGPSSDFGRRLGLDYNCLLLLDHLRLLDWLCLGGSLLDLWLRSARRLDR